MPADPAHVGLLARVRVAVRTQAGRVSELGAAAGPVAAVFALVGVGGFVVAALIVGGEGFRAAGVGARVGEVV